MKNKKTITIAGRIYNMRKSKYASNFSPVCVSDNMSGKMENIPSVSTSCLANPICLKRMQDGDSICAHCFAETTLKRYSDCGKNMLSNTYLLTESILDLDLLPRFPNVSIVRIESFGDVANVTQAINYANLCKVNPLVTFAWWTKNPAFIDKAMKIFGKKPENIIFIESSPYINVVKEKSFPWIDKVFSVFNDQYIAENNIDINCGARSCMNCKRCYTKTNTETNVSERLK